MLPRAVLLSLLLLLCPRLTHAQSAASLPAPPPALLVSGGYVAFADDGRIDHGMGGLGLEWRAMPHLAASGDLSYMVGPGSDRDLLLAATVRASVLRWSRPVVPYALVAAGALWHSARVFGADYSDVGMLLQVGGGVRIAAGRRVFIAPEFAIGGPPHIRATLTVGVTLR
ncbi:hypothetical protein TBR22_A30100 [Luteitalea sp. TBR-22]|uniref:hypothetical protein n=1 Tax=Luteitalea sp. TBR-22 TaxID=2802971 RepID=UPI001AF7CDA2|nr:hypothetical protein [Luteitalea sp. TBR-22]BCS33783.1 hypothetical protein TBR22_A30100 [Luteitalea sp. TBR-22]